MKRWHYYFDFPLVVHESNIHIGTSGWSYKHWKDVFYPSHVKAPGYLDFFAKEFNTAEINTSFYRLPSAKTLEQWKNIVPKNFRFCPKMNRFLTQMKKLNDPEESLHRFFSLFEPMKKRMGPVLFQLPPNLGFNQEKVTYVLNMLKENYPAFTVAFEARHPSWFEKPVIDLFRKYNVASVIADSGGRFPMATEVTSRTIYIRFHGPDGSYASSYSMRALARYADKCINWVAAGYEVWVFFNNDVNAYAIQNARTFRKLVENH